jgi:outer membrane protein assembly factor BamE (lipoprotein component of BamABCDE complex)
MVKKISYGIICVMILSFLLISCGTTSGTYSNKIARIEVGMSKSQVTDIMGNPTDRTVSDNTETWFYWDSWNGSRAWVDFTDGRVSGMRTDNQ